ncbi:MAG: hypothetical protein ACPGN3_13355 [Opitutales bacterium]
MPKTHQAPILKILVIALMAVCVSGCSMLKPVEDQTAYYRLSAMNLEQTSAETLGRMPLKRIVEVKFPKDVHGGKLMITEKVNTVLVFDEARWMEPFSSAFERTLDLNVRALLDRSYEDATVIVDVLSFVATDSEVKCTYTYRWSEGHGGSGVMDASESWMGLESKESLVAAIDAMTAQMSRAIVQGTRKDS